MNMNFETGQPQEKVRKRLDASLNHATFILNMRQFTFKDVTQHGAVADAGSLFTITSELVHCPLWWQKQGLQQTASGYGKKLTSSYKIHFEGKLHRLYVTCYSNSGSHWFITKGKKIFVH